MHILNTLIPEYQYMAGRTAGSLILIITISAMWISITSCVVTACAVSIITAEPITEIYTYNIKMIRTYCKLMC